MTAIELSEQRFRPDQFNDFFSLNFQPSVNIPSEDLAAIALYRRQALDHPLLSEEAVATLATQRDEAKRVGDVSAFKSFRDRIVLSNLRLVAYCGARYTKSGLPILDILQEGNIGLIRAAEGFQGTGRVAKFASYAGVAIRRAIRAALREQTGIHIPQDKDDTYSQFVREKDWLTQALSREPTPDEISQSMGDKTKTAIDLEFSRVLHVYSLENYMVEHARPGTGRFGKRRIVEREVFPIWQGNQNVVREVESNILSKQIELSLEKLSDEERVILETSFGLKGEKLSDEQMAGLFKTEVNRIKELRNRALAKLRSEPDLNQYTENQPKNEPTLTTNRPSAILAPASELLRWFKVKTLDSQSALELYLDVIAKIGLSNKESTLEVLETMYEALKNGEKILTSDSVLRDCLLRLGPHLGKIKI